MAAGAEINGKLIHEGSQSHAATAPLPTAAEKIQKEKEKEESESLATGDAAEQPG